MQILNATRLALLTVFLVINVTAVIAQETTDEPSPSPTPQASPTQTPTPAATPEPKVVRVTGNVELDDIIEINIENLEKWAETKDPSKLVPYIDGRAIKGNYPEEIHLERGRVIFHLEITPENKKVWTDLLGAPSGIKRPVAISVGLENGSAFDSVHPENNPVPLTVISPVYGLVALLVIFATLALLLWLVRKTNIIREPGPPPSPGKRRPYNLGRAQMSFWFFLIYASYLAIWLVTSALDTITSSLLALMGISAGTALGEALIDTGKDTTKTNQLQDLTAERLALEQGVSQMQTDLDAIGVAPAAVADQSNRDALNRQLIDSRTRIGQIDQQLRTLNSQTPATTSSGF